MIEGNVEPAAVYPRLSHEVERVTTSLLSLGTEPGDPVAGS